MSRTTIAGLLLAMLCAPALAQLNAQSTPEQVFSAINAKGPNAVLQSLWQEDTVFDSLLSHVDHGEQQWFGIWVELRRYADGGQSESIDMAFARAIPHAPAAILKLIGNGLELSLVCTSPFIEPDPGVAEQYEIDALKALSTVRDKNLQSVKQRCIRRVELPKQGGEQNISPHWAVRRTPTLAMASPFSWPVLVPCALRASAPVNLGVEQRASHASLRRLD